MPDNRFNDGKCSPDGRFFVEDVVSGQWSALTRDSMIKETARLDQVRYNNQVIVYVEQEGGSAGKAQAQQQLHSESQSTRKR
jgi:sugar lactone lactonase YvrE